MTDFYSVLQRSEPTRYVYFAFHYQRDIWRVQQVKNHWVTKQTHRAAGFFDGSLEEKEKKEGDDTVKNLIKRGMAGASVTCVLIGTETYTRRWVDHEIFRSVEEGMGVFGLRIHGLRDRDQKTDPAGPNPFEYLGYGTKENSDKLWPMIKYEPGWQDAKLNKRIDKSMAPYLNSQDRPILSSIFKVYDWVADAGYSNFPRWVSAAAKQAGR
jgi:MTH538 TIR-like domain (DUF1863)